MTAVLLAMSLGCRRAEVPASGLRVAAATSYLEAAACDLLGDNLTVLRLAEPGTCPGHFDIRPSQVERLRRCRVLLRFDFQRVLDARFAAAGASGPAIAEITLRSGMCVPSSYLDACRQLADHFVALGLIDRSHTDARLGAISARLNGLAHHATNRVYRAGLMAAPVICSGHQRDFCEWLGLEVVATFRAADSASISEIEAAIDVGRSVPVLLIIANRPEGRRTADALAERLKARVVVFENFPVMCGNRVSFDATLQSNLEALLGAGVP